MQRSHAEVIEGKVFRGSHDRDSHLSTVHMVRAFSIANNLVLSQLKTDAKSNEITAFPELI